jgi:segregation and condensation protein A
MTEEENILKMIIEKESWEEVIYYIVSLENLNPWDVDLVKLTESFLNFIKSSKELDFRIPAKIVFVAAILLKLKADYLSIFEEKESEIEEILKEQKPFEDLGIDPKLVQLGYPMKRIPKRQVTLDELISALKKALEVKEKKEVRKKEWKAHLEVHITFEEDITQRIEKVMKEIEDLLEKLKKDKIEFKGIVEKWNRDEIVEHFIPMLHLEHNQRIRTEQEEFFKEIWITRKNISDEKSKSG